MFTRTLILNHTISWVFLTRCLWGRALELSRALCLYPNVLKKIYFLKYFRKKYGFRVFFPIFFVYPLPSFLPTHFSLKSTKPFDENTLRFCQFLCIPITIQQFQYPEIPINMRSSSDFFSHPNDVF